MMLPTDHAYAMLRQVPREEGLTVGEAARAIGVSADTLRRWERAGKLRTRRDSANRRRVPRSEVERLTTRPERHRPGDALSARNRFPGIVRSVETDGVMALVEIEAGPHRVTAAVTRDAVEELGLAPGVRATAAVKATSVMVERME
jgi:molybdopterin-binding protein